MRIDDLRQAKYRSFRKRVVSLLESAAADTENTARATPKIATDALATMNKPGFHFPSKGQLFSVLRTIRNFPPCFCGKTALYRVSIIGYCDKHKHMAFGRRDIVNQHGQAKHQEFNRAIKEQDYRDTVNGTPKNSGNSERIRRASVKRGHRMKPSL